MNNVKIKTKNMFKRIPSPRTSTTRKLNDKGMRAGK